MVRKGSGDMVKKECLWKKESGEEGMWWRSEVARKGDDKESGEERK